MKKELASCAEKYHSTVYFSILSPNLSLIECVGRYLLRCELKVPLNTVTSLLGLMVGKPLLKNTW